MDDIYAWYQEVPPFTRYFLTTSLFLSFCMTYGILDPMSLVLIFDKLLWRLQIWRLITPFVFAGTFSQNFLFSMVMAYMTLRRCEDFFAGKYPDFVVLVAFSMIASGFFSWLYGNYMVLQQPFLFCLMYVWCKLVPDVTIMLYFFPVQSKNLPWVLVAFSVLTGGDPFTDLIGIAAGHSYYFLRHVLPQSHGYNWLATPRWAHALVQYLENWSRQPSSPNGFLGKWG